MPGANLTFSKTDTPTVFTKGRILDHIGFDVIDLEAAAKRFQENGIKLDRGIETLPNGVKLLCIHEPWGTNIEVNQRDTRCSSPNPSSVLPKHVGVIGNGSFAASLVPAAQRMNSAAEQWHPLSPVSSQGAPAAVG